MTWWLWLGLVLCLLAVAAVGLSAYGAKRGADTTRTLTRRLEAGRIDEKVWPPFPARFDPRELDGLPGPVQRYFRAALREGQPIISAVTVELAGRFNLLATGEQWKPVTSRQRVVTRRPGFLWDAKVSVLPGLAVRVHDGYIAGEAAWLRPQGRKPYFVGAVTSLTCEFAP